MLQTRVTGLALAGAFLLAAAIALGACGGTSEPEKREFDLGIVDRKLNLDPPVIEVKQGDTVNIRIASDEHGNFHLHGYDIVVGVGPDETATMDFTANATGKFPITFHPGAEGTEGAHDEGADSEEGERDEDEEGEEVPLAELRVQPR